MKAKLAKKTDADQVEIDLRKWCLDKALEGNQDFPATEVIERASVFRNWVLSQ